MNEINKRNRYIRITLISLFVSLLLVSSCTQEIVKEDIVVNEERAQEEIFD